MRSDPYKQDNIRKGAFHYLLGRGTAGVAGFLIVLLLVRFMDLKNYAIFTALSGLIAVCGVLAGLGMERIVSRYIPEARLHHTVDELSRFIWIISAVRLLAALLIVALLYVFWSHIEKLVAVAELKDFSACVAFFIVGETMFQHFSSILQALIMQKMLTRLLVIQWGGRLLIIVIVVLMKSGIDWEESFWIFAIPELLGVLAFMFVIKAHLHEMRGKQGELENQNWPQWKKVATVGANNFGFNVLIAPPQGYFMKVLTAAYLPIEVVAAYGFFISVAEKIRQYIPLHFFYGLLEPVMIASYLKERDFSALSYRCQLLYKANLLLMVPVIAWVAVAGDSFVGLMTGGKFHGLSWILLLVLVQLTSGSHIVLLQLLLNSLEESKTLIKASTTALPVMILAMAAAIHFSPIWLLCTPILFSLTMNLYIVFHLARGNHPYRPHWKMLGGVSFSGLAAFAVIKILLTLLPWSAGSLVTVIFTFSGIAIVYLLMLWLSKAIDKSEIALIKTILLTIGDPKWMYAQQFLKTA